MSASAVPPPPPPPRRSMIGEPLAIVAALRRTSSSPPTKPPAPPPSILVVDFGYPNPTRTTTSPEDMELLVNSIKDHPSLEKLSLFHVNICDARNKTVVAPQFRRLLAEAIATHKTLQSLAIVHCHAPPGGLGSTLFASLTATMEPKNPPKLVALKKLEVVHTYLEASDCAALGQMLARGTARIEELTIRHCTVKCDPCRALCVGAGHSRFLKKLVMEDVSGLEVMSDTVSPAFFCDSDSPESAGVLARVEIGASVWTEDGLEGIAKALQGNCVAKHVVFRSTDLEVPCGFPDAGVEAIVSALEHHNSTLSSLKLECRGQDHPRSKDIRRLLRRNAGAKAFCVQFETPNGLPPLRSLFPQAIYEVGMFPSLLHHMVRNNVGALAEMAMTSMAPPTTNTEEEEPTTKEKPKKEEPATEQPTKEEPATEKPMKEEPTDQRSTEQPSA